MTKAEKEAKNKAAQSLGKLGGRARVAALSPDAIQKHSKLMANNRWKDATPEDKAAHVRMLVRTRLAKQAERKELALLSPSERKVLARQAVADRKKRAKKEGV